MAEIRHAVVTGPTGAVGVALINELIRAGAKVTAVCNPRSRRTAHIPSYGGVNIVYCDASDYVHLPLLIDRKTDAFFHLAWTGTYGSVRQDYEMQARNVEYSTAAAMAAKTLGCDVFIGAGSQAECGNTEGALTPNTVCDPETAYGAAKLAAMYTTRTYCKSEGMRHVWCRIVSLFGPGDRPYTLVSQVIARLLAGEHVSCTRGDQVWDYLYSKDAARAIRLAAEKGADSALYCIGSGNARPLRSFVEAIRDEIDEHASIGFGEIEYYPNQVMHLEADISDLVNDTGFSPRYTFEEGIRETVEWMESQFLGIAGKDEK